MKRHNTILLILSLFFTVSLHAQTPANNTVRLGFLIGKLEQGLYDDAKTAIRLWLNDIGKTHELSTDTRFFTEYEALLESLKKDELDGIIFSTHAYLQNSKQLNPYIQDGWIASNVLNTMFFKYLVVSRSDNSYKEKKKLRISYDSNEILCDIVLKNYMHPFNKEFEYIPSKTPSKALLKLFFNKCDIVVVPERTWKTSVELNPQVGTRLHVISQSDPIFTDLISFYTKNIASDLKKKFVDATTHLHESKEGKELSSLFKMKQLMPITKTDLRPLRDFYSHYIEHIKQ